MKRMSAVWRPTIPVLAAAMLTGCAMQQDGKTPQWIWKDPIVRSSAEESGPVEQNIVRVNKFFSQTPWLSYANDGSRRVDGVTFSIYLEGPNSPKGVFGTGVITVTMYRLDADETGREVAKKIYEWEYDAQAAYPFRAKTQTALGWGYGMRLRWGENLDVEGRQVAFVIKYMREDGRTVSSSRQVLKVPGPEGAGPIVQRTGGVVDAPPPKPKQVTSRVRSIQPTETTSDASTAPRQPVAAPAPRTRPKPRVTVTVQPKPDRPKPRYAGPTSGEE